jgi:hypothetical protein
VWLRPELGARLDEQQTGQHGKPVDKQADEEFTGICGGPKQAKSSPGGDIQSGQVAE